MSKISFILDNAKNRLAAIGIESAHLDAEVILAHVLDCKRIDLYLERDRQISSENNELFEKLIERRLKREPVAYITGHKEFWSLKIFVTPSVIVPRPETEIIVEKALDAFRDKKCNELTLLDLCTGSGCVAAALATEFTRAKIWATDISRDAIDVAKKNTLFANTRVNCVQGNLFEAIKGTFDLITANPPYISDKDYATLDYDIRGYEPRLALVADTDGLAISMRIIKDAWKYLKPNGHLIIEIGIGQFAALQKFADEIGSYKTTSVVKDYSGIERTLVIQKK